MLLDVKLVEYGMIGKAWKIATNPMTAEAKELGAHAIINARISRLQVAGTAAELLAYGHP